ncbi:MAG: membrane protein insertase YidC [Caldisericales bacterium]|nr:membrane protein insertase YidC [Caldisericales bacterium]
MKKIAAILAITLLTIWPVAGLVSGAQLSVKFSTSVEALAGNSSIVPVEVTNTGSESIENAFVTISSFDGKPLGLESGARLVQGSQEKIGIQRIDAGSTEKIKFQIEFLSSLKSGAKKIAFSLESNGQTVTGESEINVNENINPPSAKKIIVSSDAESYPNSNFTYTVKVENPKSDSDGVMDMVDLKVELLSINGKQLKEFTPEEAKKDSFFRPIFKSSLVVSPDNPERKLAPGDSFEAKFMLATGPDIELGSYKAKIKITWQPADTKLPMQTNEIEGNIEVKQVTWYTFAVRWVIDGLAKTVGFGNYAITIIIFALLVKLCFWPLSNAQFKNMEKMAKIQPLLNALKQKYPRKEDAQKLQEETMAIYKENNVNFLSGCLPLLIQLPIVMALYSGISGFAPLNYANFIWLPSLCLADPFYIMPILLAASTWLQQKVSTMPGQDQQSASFQIMFPAMMFLFGINFPSGISLYWFMFNLASIIHQMVYNKGAFGKFIPTGIIKPVSKGIKK